MIKHFYKKLSLLLICVLPTLAHASFTITPVKLKINKDEKIAAVTIKNDSNEVKNFQLIVYKVENIDGKETYKETKDLVVTPVMFKIQPGKSQLVRVAIKNKMYSVQENAYTLSVKELPHKMNKEGANVQLVTEFKIPVSVEAADQKEESDTK
jgi:fimbrial chaperone protein